VLGLDFPAGVQLANFMVNFGVLALFYAFIGQSWNIAGGFAGQLSFGHVAFFGVGAYASTIGDADPLWI
jgi:branched-chain amino acid transport system permease protein